MDNQTDEQQKVTQENKIYEDVDIGLVASSLSSQFDEEIMKISQDKV
jgi:hypothetical protein